MKYKYIRIIRDNGPIMNEDHNLFFTSLKRAGKKGYKVIDKHEFDHAIEYLLIKEVNDKKHLKINKERLINLGFVEHDGDFFYEKGRHGLIVSKAQGNDLMLLYRSDIGVDYNPLKFIEYVHEIEDLFFAITGNKLESKSTH